jgi:tRNA uracil 4-sulfurtransferase
VKQSQILIRYGEIGLKAENTRRRFIQRLKTNILHACSQEGLSVRIMMERGRIFLHTENIKKTSEVLKKIFGIVSFSPVWESSSELSELEMDVLNLLTSRITSKTSFALRVRRSGNHYFTSQDAAVQIGQSVCDRFHSPVDLEQPDVELFIEIRDEKAFLFLEKVTGIGGLPYATQGKVCCLVYHPRDILSSWFLMKRGCSIGFFTDKASLLDQINEFLKMWYINQTPTLIDSNLQNSSAFLKEEIEKRRFEAICTGETCKNHGKELLNKMIESKNLFTLPILTPLIGMNDKQIQNFAEGAGIRL